MPDYPGAAVDPQQSVVGTFGLKSIALDVCVYSNLAARTGAVWPAANRALYCAVWVEQPMVARRLFCRPTVQSGNLDMGIYDAKGNRIVSKGSTAVGVTTALQIIDITASVTGTASPVLLPGMYFLALNVDNVTAAMTMAAPASAEICRIAGVQQQAVGAVTLPNPATFANPASAYIPSIGMFAGTVM
jgi:hypothetical protein